MLCAAHRALQIQKEQAMETAEKGFYQVKLTRSLRYLAQAQSAAASCEKSALKAGLSAQEVAACKEKVAQEVALQAAAKAAKQGK